MSIVDSKIFNLLVHYGQNYSLNLIDLLEEVLAEKLLLGEEVDGRAKMYVDEVTTEKVGKKIFLTGYFYRESHLKWTYVSDPNRRHRKDPGQQHVFPKARFYLDLEEHRLFWLTNRGMTHSPTAYHFCSYLRKLARPVLVEKYRAEANVAWRSKKGREKGESHSKFVSRYLSDKNVTRNTFKIAVVPEVTQSRIVEILRQKRYVVKRASFFPHMNNVTKKHLVDLFTTAGMLGSEAESVSELSLEPINDKKGVKKEPIFKLMEHNERSQLLKFEFILKDSDNPTARQFKIANTDTENDNSSIQKSHSVNADLEDEGLLVEVLESEQDIKPRDMTAHEKSKITKRIKALIGR